MEISRGYVVVLNLVSIMLTLNQQSILVDSSGRARITDFGLATVTQRVGSVLSILDEYQQTARWTAPEILNDQGSYSKQADIFSFAMVTIAVRYRSPAACGGCISLLTHINPGVHRRCPVQ